MPYIFIAFSIVAVLAWGLWLGKQFWSRPREWANFAIAAWSAAFATLIFGFVVGYSIYYIQHSQESQERAEQESKHALDNRTRILALTTTELTYDPDALQARGADHYQSLAHIHATPLKNEFWKMLSASGDIRWISDYELLFKLSDAYFRLENTMYWEHQFLEAATSTGMAMTVKMSDGTSMPLPQYVWSLTAPTYPEAEKSITGALEAINQVTQKH